MPAAADSRGPAAAFSRGLVIQAEVIYAVVLRETRTRYGAHRMGYLWAIIEPAIVILTFYGLFAIISRPAPAGMDVFSFITTGLVPYTIFANTTIRVAESINGNRALLYYPHVQPIDLAIARGALELATLTGVFIALMGGHALIVQKLVIGSPLHVILGLALASLLGTTLGLVFCCLGQRWVVVDRARGPLLRPFFWISGIFFTAADVPDAMRNVALKNPVFHPVELVRAGWFPDYTDEYADPLFVLAIIAVFGVIGLLLERDVRRRIEM